MSDMTGRSPLRELYDAVVAANGWSQRDIEARARDRGYPISKSRIGQLTNAPVLDSITSDSVRALAVGLGVSPERVALAAVQSMGFRVGVDEVTPAEAILRDETLSEDTRAALLAVLRGAHSRSSKGA